MGFVIILDENGKRISTQTPLATDGDSVYVKDLDIKNCTADGFTFDVGEGTEKEVIEDMVSSVFVGKSNDSSDNPKTVYLQFKRPILTASFGVNSAPGKFFSNMKIVLGQGEHTWTVLDDSADNTQYQIFIVPIEPVKFSSMRITFHTDNEIGIGLIGIFKNIEVASRLQALKPDGTVADIQATAKGNLKVAIEEMELEAQTPFELRVSKGEIAGHSVMSKFGQNDDIGTGAYEDIWDGGGTYTYPANGTAPITKLVAHDANDTEPIEVQGLDVNGDLVVQTKTLTGLTAVTLDTPLWRVFRLKNIGTSDLISNVCAINDGDTVDYACIDNGNNQTLMALYTIPNGKTGYLVQGTNSIIGSLRDYNIAGKLWMRPYGLVFQLKKTFALDTGGSSYMVMPFPLPGKIPAKTDIRVSAISSKAGGGLNTTFEVLLIDD